MPVAFCYWPKQRKMDLLAVGFWDAAVLAYSQMTPLKRGKPIYYPNQGRKTLAFWALIFHVTSILQTLILAASKAHWPNDVWNWTEPTSVHWKVSSGNWTGRKWPKLTYFCSTFFTMFLTEMALLLGNIPSRVCALASKRRIKNNGFHTHKSQETMPLNWAKPATMYWRSEKSYFSWFSLQSSSNFSALVGLLKFLDKDILDYH